MRKRERLTPGQGELASALSQLRPATPQINRDQVMFLAGRASVRRRDWAWLGVTAAMAIVAAASVSIRPEPRVVERIVRVEPPASETPAAPFPAPAFASVTAGQAEYLRLRQAVLEEGLAALPELNGYAPTASGVEDLHQLLGTPARAEAHDPLSDFFKRLTRGGLL